MRNKKEAGSWKPDWTRERESETADFGQKQWLRLRSMDKDMDLKMLASCLKLGKLYF
jgi:hypothetical protein